MAAGGGLLLTLMMMGLTSALSPQVHTQGGTINRNYTHDTMIDTAAAAAAAAAQRIIGGKEVESAMMFPWQVYVKSYKWVGSLSYSSCGGSIISLGWVMSAAHCVTEYDDDNKFHIDVKRIKLYAGVYDRTYLYGSDVQSDILNEDDFERHVFVNPEFRKGAYRDNDVTIFKLKKQFTLTDTVKPIELATSNDLYVGQTLIASGWGRVCDDCENLPNILRYVNLKLISQSECIYYYGSNKITDNMICHKTEDKNTCSGDSGGPVITGRGYSNGPPYVQIGIVSWGISDCDKEHPRVFADVTELGNWIKITMESPGGTEQPGVTSGTCSGYKASSRCYRYYENGIRKYCLSGEQWSQSECKCISSSSCQHSCLEHKASSKCYSYYFYNSLKNCPSGTQWSQSNCKCISSSSCKTDPPSPPPTTTTTTTTAGPVNDICEKYGSSYKAHEQCYSYNQMVHGSWIIMRCAPGSFWNQFDCECSSQSCEQG